MKQFNAYDRKRLVCTSPDFYRTGTSLSGDISSAIDRSLFFRAVTVAANTFLTGTNLEEDVASLASISPATKLDAAFNSGLNCVETAGTLAVDLAQVPCKAFRMHRRHLISSLTRILRFNYKPSPSPRRCSRWVLACFGLGLWRLPSRKS